MILFKRRWQDRILLRKPEILTKVRDESINQKTLDNFFDMLHKILNSNGFLVDADAADCIFNADESEFSKDSNQKKIFFKKSSKDIYLLTPTTGKAMYTVFVCDSASGFFMPPLDVYKGLHLYGS